MCDCLPISVIKRREIPIPYVNFADPPPSPRKVAIAMKLSESSDAIMRALREPRRGRKR